MSTQKYDLVVIGGGVLGTFHAYHALLMGKKVLQLEKDNYPVGATVRNFGQVVASGMSKEWFDYGVRSTEIYQQIQQEFDITVRKNGSVYIASDPDEQLLIHELSAHYDTHGYAHEMLSKKEVLKKYTSVKESYAKEAIFFEQEISVEPTLMIHQVHEYMRTKFPEFTQHYNAPVIDCATIGNEVCVKLTNGKSFTADQAVLCNGYEFKLLFPDIFAASGQVISKLQMMRTVPLPIGGLEGNILTGLTIRRYESFEEYCPSFKSIATPEHYAELKANGIHMLFKTAPDGSIIIGDSHEYADVNHFDDLGFKINASINKLMLMEAERIVAIPVRKIDTAWAGYYPQHPTKNIIEHEVDERIHIRTCIGGKGMTASAGYAEYSIGKIFGN